MKSKHIVVGAAIASIMAATSPAYAGLLGGAGSLGGNFGGNLGGTVSDFGIPGRLGSTGSPGGQGAFDSSISAVTQHPASNTVDQMHALAADAGTASDLTSAATGSVTSSAMGSDARSATGSATGGTMGSVARGTAGNATGNAMGSASHAASLASASPAPAAGKPAGASATSAPPSKPTAAGSLRGGADSIVNAGEHSASEHGSVSAQHSDGSTATDATGMGSLN